MDNQKYRSWSNWDTYNVALWMKNVARLEKLVNKAKSAKEIKKIWIYGFNNPSNVDLEKVNFEEIFYRFRFKRS